VAGVGFVKGHGTENDFVVLPDLDAALELTPARVRALCDRHRGIGADGVLRVLPVARVANQLSDVDVSESAADWFMDYRNADGSIAEMCGNGVRVFARYLVATGLAIPGTFNVATRNGDRQVIAPAGDADVTVEMGPARITGKSTATLDGTSFPGIAVDVGNPHLVCVCDADLDIASLDLANKPGYDTEMFPAGVNVEFVTESAPGELRMRVHERGVGETRSCGTGTVAAVAAALHLAGQVTGESTVRVPGGTLAVAINDEGSTLTGPAVLVGRGELAPAWWTAAVE
jgi:diaminopimelate epimerase